MALKRIIYLTDTEYETLKSTGRVEIPAGSGNFYPDTEHGETLSDIDFKVKDKSKEELDKKLDLFTETSHPYTTVYAVEKNTNRQIQINVDHPGDDSLLTRGDITVHVRNSLKVPIEKCILQFTDGLGGLVQIMSSALSLDGNGTMCASFAMSYFGDDIVQCCVILNENGNFSGYFVGKNQSPTDVRGLWEIYTDTVDLY